MLRCVLSTNWLDFHGIHHYLCLQLSTTNNYDRLIHYSCPIVIRSVWPSITHSFIFIKYQFYSLFSGSKRWTAGSQRYCFKSILFCFYFLVDLFDYLIVFLWENYKEATLNSKISFEILSFASNKKSYIQGCRQC